MRRVNGQGSITKEKGTRRRPYRIRVWVNTDDGRRIRKNLGYAATRLEAENILNEYLNTPWSLSEGKKTFNEVYQLWLENNTLAPSTVRGYKTIYRNYCEPLLNIEYQKLRTYHFIEIIKSCSGSQAYKARFKKFFRQLDKTALQFDIINKGYAEFIPTEKVEINEKKPFTEDEIDLLWDNLNLPNVDLILVLIYTGFRREEFINLKKKDFDLKNWTLKGGAKTEAGKNRIVPIHERIKPLVVGISEKSKNENLFGFSYNTLGERFRKVMKQLGLKHSPHEARHTFRTRLYNAGVGNVEIDLMMGHSSSSIGERIYTHQRLSQLRAAIEKLR